jgi:hypothetical protein
MDILIMVGVPGIHMDQGHGFEGGYHVQGLAIGYGEADELACFGAFLAIALFHGPLDGRDVIVTGFEVAFDIAVIAGEVWGLEAFWGAIDYAHLKLLCLIIF